jgi:hypothetical protein
MLWDVGVSDMVGDFSLVRAPHERGFLVRWRRRPDWHLPLGVRHLINGTLDRPFQDAGMQLRLTLRDAEAAQTLVLRRFDVAVQESAIVRWLGNLGGSAMNDFAGPAEAEENRFTADDAPGTTKPAARDPLATGSGTCCSEAGCLPCAPSLELYVLPSGGGRP